MLSEDEGPIFLPVWLKYRNQNEYASKFYDVGSACVHLVYKSNKDAHLSHLFLWNTRWSKRGFSLGDLSFTLC